MIVSHVKSLPIKIFNAHWSIEEINNTLRFVDPRFLKMGGSLEGCPPPSLSWADHTMQFRHHPSASPALIVRKVVGHHLFLNIIPNNFTAWTEWKVWCDRDINNRWTWSKVNPVYHSYNQASFVLGMNMGPCPKIPPKTNYWENHFPVPIVGASGP